LSAASVAAVAGAFLVVLGAALTAVQLLRGVPVERTPTRSMEAGAGPMKFALKTTFPGLVLVGFGVLLIVVGVIAD
jgi:hypothetical protein